MIQWLVREIVSTWYNFQSCGRHSSNYINTIVLNATEERSRLLEGVHGLMDRSRETARVSNLSREFKEGLPREMTGKLALKDE